ncbi:MAG: hypothetical protein AMJ78_00610 [Omnitrophica WOR_2 bacterium SM23_29]|nr:MAG: hypothetical protein AMJ78_00610 [Omnitrophica WOR_2 bacterium SM23_29]
MDPKTILNKLFLKAKSKDEFEYICALLRIRGMESAGWDPFEETQHLFNDIVLLSQAPLKGDTQVRLLLFIYCHITEVDAIYCVLENMLRTIEGERCSIAPFRHLYGRRKNILDSRPPSAKQVVQALQQHTQKLNEQELSDLLTWMFNDQVRNAFFHSDYTIFKDEFRSREANFRTNNVITKSMKINDLIELINRGLNFFQGFMSTYYEHRLSYKEPKIIYGRIGANGGSEPVELLVSSNGGGVFGFKSINGK